MNGNEGALTDLLRLVEALERKFDAVRGADQEAVKLQHSVLRDRLEGFPQLFATKAEQDAVKDTVQRLEKDSVSREIYDQQQKQMGERLVDLSRAKLDVAAFDAFMEAYEVEQRRAADERRLAAEVLAKQNEAMRTQIMDEHRTYVTEESYSHRHQALIRQVDAVERWQYKLVGGLVFATFVAPIVSAVIVYIFTRQP